VDWLFGRFRGRAARRPLVCYLRENGPIAYACDVFGRDPRERAGAMLAIDLAWYWRTIVRDAGARDWTRLTAWSLAALLTDLGARDDGVEPRLLLIALDLRDAPPAVNDAEVARWSHGFSGGVEHPLHAVVSRPAPGGDLVFVAQQPPESVRALLQAWGIDRDRADRRAYPKLQSHSLEYLMKFLANERSE
jgi:hypothetical protein